MTSIADQYRIISTAAGWIDRRTRGRIRFAGADARTFLQGLVTNDVSALEPGRGVYAAYLTPQGRMIADIVLLNRGDAVLGLVGDNLGSSLAARFDQLVFTEDVTIADVSADLAEIEVTGGAAARVVAQVAGADEHALASLADLAQIDVAGGFVLRDGASPFPAYQIFIAPADRDRIVAGLDAAGAVAMSEEMATALRIESGRGLWGHDLRDDVIPLEAGLLDRAISTSKGCYVGQEIVIRMLHRGGGRVAKRLVTLAFDPSTTEAPAAGAAIAADGTTAGALTSVAFSPARGAFVALGYVRREAAETGRQVAVADSGARATIIGFGQ